MPINISYVYLCTWALIERMWVLLKSVVGLSQREGRREDRELHLLMYDMQGHEETVYLLAQPRVTIYDHIAQHLKLQQNIVIENRNIKHCKIVRFTVMAQSEGTATKYDLIKFLRSINNILV